MTLKKTKGSRVKTTPFSLSVPHPHRECVQLVSLKCVDEFNVSYARRDQDFLAVITKFHTSPLTIIVLAHMESGKGSLQEKDRMQQR